MIILDKYYIMRDLLNTLSFLQESTGLAGRKPGDVFRNPQEDEIVFDNLEFYPQGGGKFTPVELDAALQDISAQVPNISWQNAKSAKTGGFGIAAFNSDNGTIYIGRFFNSINPNKTDNYFANTVGDYKFGGKSAAKAQAGLSPQDLLQNKIDLTIKDIMLQLSTSLGTNNPLYHVAHKVAMGEGFPIKFPTPPGISFSAFRDYFCEILQPMALHTGMYSGNAGEAASRFLSGGFNDTIITFDDSKTAGLSDSIMTTSDGRYVKVSTKGGKGATASAKNLIDSVKELEHTDAGRKLMSEHADIIDMIKEIQQAGQAGAPLMLGVNFEIITPEDAEMVKRLKNLPPVKLSNIKSLNLSPILVKLAQKRKTDNPDQVNMYYHLIAAIAHDAAEKVNNQTDFSKVAAKILNNGALVQVYTIAKEGKTEWVLQDFETVYPGDSIKGVYLSASKTYYSTGIKGNYTFKIDKTKGAPEKEPNEDPEVRSTTDPEPDLSSAARQITTQKSTRAKRQPVGDVGRQKRK